MTKLATGHVFMAMSLDGFVARKDNDIGWLMQYDAQGQDQGYDAFVKNIDGLVMGSGTFKTVLGFDQWPYQKPVWVMSRSMKTADIPDNLRATVQITNLAPTALMEQLFAQGLKRVYVDGGLVVQSFLKAGLIKDMTLTIIPILLGEGKRLFGEVDRDIHLELRDSNQFKCGFVQNHYQVLKEN